MGMGITPGLKIGYPLSYPYLALQVWVFMGKGTGKVKNTYGLPMQNTMHMPSSFLLAHWCHLQLLPFLFCACLLLLCVRSLALICLCLCSFSLLYVVPPVPVKPKLAFNIVFMYSPFVGLKGPEKYCSFTYFSWTSGDGEGEEARM